MTRDARGRMVRFTSTELPPGRPEWIHVMPFGAWKGYDSNRVITFGEKEAEEAVANQVRWGIDVVIDFEHQTLNTLENGREAPAMGWIDRFEAREDGVWGHVKEWTARGAAALDAREYRYLSPVLVHDIDRRTGEPVGMHIRSVALTNNPFLAGDLVPVVNSSNSSGGSMTLLAALIALLGLPETATEQDVIDTVTSLKEMSEAPAAGAEAAPEAAAARAKLATAVCKAFKWAKIPADAETQLAAALRHDGFVPRSELTKLQGELLTAQSEAALAAGKSGVEQLVARALESGKITPALEAAFRNMASNDLVAATAWLDQKAAVIVPLGSPRRGPKGADNAGDDDDLSPVERQTIAQLGVTNKNYLAARAARRATLK